MKDAYCKKAILYLESEIDFLKFASRQADQPSHNNINPCTSKVYFVPKSKGLGIDGMGEFAVSFDLSHDFFDEEGKPASLIQISKALENAFNFSFGDIYKTKARVFIRKPCNLTRALDYLKNLIARENRNKKMKKDDFAII